MTPELLISLLHRWNCPSTHQRLMLDALRHLRDPHADAWRRLLLIHHRQLLAGAVAPDTQARDFENHVLYIRDDYWGGAVMAAESAMQKLRMALDHGDWPGLAFAVGTLGHYYMDPIQPLHTAQSDAANDLHAAFEWSVAHAYDRLVGQVECHEEWPDVHVPETPNWLASMIVAGAERARRQYETLVDRFNFDLAIHDPQSGLDAECQERIASLLSYAIVGYARILDRLFSEIDWEPPESTLTRVAIRETLALPARMSVKRIASTRKHAAIERMYFELCSRGRVEKCLSEEVRAIRDAYQRHLGSNAQDAA